MVSPQTSILLNPTYPPSTHIPLASGSSLANSSTHPSSSKPWQSPIASSAPRSAPSTPRIRFAAFPDPRRGVLITDDGDELPLDCDEDEATLSTSAILNGESSKFSEAAAGTFRQADIHLPGISPASSISTPSSTDSHDSYLTVPRAIGGSSSSTTPIASGSGNNSPYSTVPISRTSSIASSIYNPSSGISSSSSSSTPGSPSSSTTWKKIKPTRLLAPFLRRSSSPCPPVASQGFNISAEELFTLGAINLFRTESRESAKSGRTTTSLRRWSSGGSGATSDSGADGRFKASASTASKRRLSASSATGARMLNGRVYGAAQNKAHLYRNKNPFANVHAEPDFVEWGYGGMGAVQSSSPSSPAAGRTSTDARWSKLQGGTSLAGGGGGGDDDDDGSGAAWVRKRREAREKAAREKAEKEEAEAQAQAQSAMEQGKKKEGAGDNDTIIDCARESSDTLPAAAAATVAAAKKEGEQEAQEGAADTTIVASPVEEMAATTSPSEPVPSASADEPAESSSSALVEQVPETASAVTPISEPTEEAIESSAIAAVTAAVRSSLDRPQSQAHHVSSSIIPPTTSHHHHHHHHHHTSSVVVRVTPGENTPVPASSQLGTPKGDVVENPIGATPASVISSSTDESDEDEEDNGEERERSSTDEDEDEEEEEENDEDDMQEKRKTAVGAGVEKYTRHLDKE